jgi:hypothetical protein
MSIDRRRFLNLAAAGAIAAVPIESHSERFVQSEHTPGTGKSLDVDYVPKDEFFGKPFIDLDEMREFPRPHRYVHGGFAGTSTLFSYYFPASSKYGGRFAQWFEGGAGGNERSITVSQSEPKPTQWDYLYDMAFDDISGYLIESNQGHKQFDKAPEAVPNLYSWRASAECARFSRHVAKQIYGKAPHHGYCGGIGGGGGRATLCLENAPDVYHGCTPQIIGSSVSAYSAMQRAILFIGNEKLKQVIDAVEPGGSGDPYASLNALQREALADLYRTGYPRGAENQLKHTRTIGFTYMALERQDPGYFEDFWKVAGYAGADRAALLSPYLIHTKAKVKRIVPISESMEPATLQWYAVLPPDLPFAVELDIEGLDQYYGCEMTVLNGDAKGRNLFIYGTFHGLSGSPERTPEMMRGIKVGDEVELDNRRFIAFLHYFLYSVEAPKDLATLTHQPIIRSGRPFAPDNIPIYPQRTNPPGAGDLKGAFNGKMIYVLSTHDIYVWPVTAGYPDIYGARYGDALPERFRFYWAQNGAIGPPQLAVGYNVGEGDLRVWDTRLIDFQHSMGRQVWRYLKEWVEDGKVPPSGTSYHFNDANELFLPATAKERLGIQPVVHATANGARRAAVRIGERVHFAGTIEAPPDAGTIVEAGWDFLQTADYPVKDPTADGTATTLSISTDYAFKEAGTYFVALRAGIHRDGKHGTGAATHNLDRVRVVVS